MQQLTQGTFLHGGAYKIEKVLGQGSFGITYLAVHTNLGKKVAIKEFFMKELNSRGEDGSITGMSDGSLSQNYCQKFQKEAVNLSHLDHPNIVRVTESFSDNGTFYYVMEYIYGQNLNDYVKRHNISEEEAVDIIKSVADALIYMHEEKHMLHLDLKPSNIMRRNKGHIFLIDFGLSKHFSDDGQPETSTTIGLGTTGYAPIEQANRSRNGEFRPTIDVYALGATLYKLLTRETPPPASDLVSDGELLENKLREKGVSVNLIKVITEAMCPNVKKRTQSVREFRDALTCCSVQTVKSESASTKVSEEETVVVNKATQTTDGEETVVVKNGNLPSNKKVVEETYEEDNDCEDTSHREIKYFIACLVPLVILYFVFLGFRGCRGDENLTSGQCADSIENALASIEYPQNASGEAVDLGLPSGTLWADRNLDASDETDEGGLFIWGDPTGMNDTVKVPDNVYNISGTEYDIVKEKWGDDWCMPNLEQFKELHDQCSIKKIEKNNIKGYLVTGPNGNTLFFPFSSLYKDEYFGGWEYQMSWTDTREEDYVLSCNIVDGFHNSDPTLKFTIRPVRSKPATIEK